jgi:sigma-B regulation protein RsbU (phosphoserine phosphatase)
VAIAELSIQSADGTKERFPLVKERVTIGRSRESDIFLPDQWLSRQHAEVRRRPDGFYVADLKSKNGTLLNGQAVQVAKRLRPGDVIQLGEHTLTFTEGGAVEVEEEVEPEGTRVFSVRELSDINTKPAIDPAELARQNRVLTVLSNATKALVEHRPLSELFETILDLLFEAVTAERGAIMLLDGDPPSLQIKASRSRMGAPLTHVSRAISRKVMENRVSALLPSLLEDAQFKTSDSILASGIRSAMCAPLWYTATADAQDAVIGLVYLDSLQRSHSFSEEDLQILTALANVAAAKIENVRLLEESLAMRRLEQDMRVAAEIQRSLLPRAAPPVPGYGLIGLNQPSRTVGGDYYDYAIEDGRLLMALGDVAGKGMGAALIMTMLRASVRAHWTSPLAEAMSRINHTICQNVPENKYITFVLARLDPVSGRVAYVNAGHNPPLLIRGDGSVERLENGGMVLGLFESVPYSEGGVEMARGDTLLVYSDGLTETFDEEGGEFGDKGLTDVAVRGRGLDVATLESEILKELDRFSNGAKATDDRTLIVLKRY